MLIHKSYILKHAIASRYKVGKLLLTESYVIVMFYLYVHVATQGITVTV